MKISVMGIEYNHLLSGKVLAEMGNEIVYISSDNKRIDNIKRGYYNSDEAMVLRSFDKDVEVGFTTDIREALLDTNMCFISEGAKDSSTEEMIKVLKTAQIVGANMSKDMFIVDRSGIFNSKIDAIKDVIQEELYKRDARFSFEVISNPDFLRV